MFNSMTINDNKKEDETKVIHIIRYARIKGYLVTELQIKHHHERILKFPPTLYRIL